MSTRFPAAVAAAAATALLAAATAGGIVGGTPDTAVPTKYPNVGLIEVYGLFGDFWMPACTGTVIAPKVVVTAGHCTIYVDLGILPPAAVRVSFDPAPQTIYYPARPAPTYYVVTAAVTEPAYLARGPMLSGSAAEMGAVPDVGVLRLADAVPVPPAPLVTPGALADAKGAVVTKVGYGYNGFARGAWGTPNAVPEIDGYRSYVDSTVVESHDAVSARFLKTSSGSCFGDSGGPSFLDGRVAAVGSYAASRTCSSTGYSTRLDTPEVQAFLTGVLAG